MSVLLMFICWKKYGDVEIRKAKTDKKDAIRIAKYAVEKKVWT